VLIQSGAVMVNGLRETRRGRKLVAGDIVTVGGVEYIVCMSPS
jgi:ribosome-associated protein YbcJ (S4-like RNA binding protein)